MNILYILKGNKSRSWSDVLQRQFEWLKDAHDGKVIKLEMDTASLNGYADTARRIKEICEEQDIRVIYCNHIICAYAVAWFVHRYRKQSKRIYRVLSLHEGEPVVGMRYWLKNIRNYKITNGLRYSRLYHFLPLHAFNKVLVLNDRQRLFGRYASSYQQSNFLGVAPLSGSASQHQPPSPASGRPVRIFFPNDYTRLEKGFQELEKALSTVAFSYELKKGGGIPHAEMEHHYREADLVVLCGEYETYSMVLLEAMLHNKYILASPNIGLVSNLLSVYKLEDLRNSGLIVTDFKEGQPDLELNYIHNLLQTNKPAHTYDLLVANNLTEADANARLLQILKQKS